jgi:transcriptional regulator with XRE-family HTH domain
MSTMATIRIRTFSGEKLRDARVARGWSRGRLAIAVDKTVTSVASFENGQRSPAAKTLQNMALALGIEPGDLLSLPRADWGMAEYRIVVGLDQRDVADRAGISPSMLSQIESTYERMNPTHKRALARLYGISEDELSAAWERSRVRATAGDS